MHQQRIDNTLEYAEWHPWCSERQQIVDHGALTRLTCSWQDHMKLTWQHLKARRTFVKMFHEYSRCWTNCISEEKNISQSSICRTLTTAKISGNACLVNYVVQCSINDCGDLLCGEICPNKQPSCLCALQSRLMLSGCLWPRVVLKLCHLAPVFFIYLCAFWFMSLQNIMEKQEMWRNEFGWTTCVAATRHHRVHSVAMLLPSATLKCLSRQKVDYFRRCGNNKIWRKLLWIPYKLRWVMIF